MTVSGNVIDSSRTGFRWSHSVSPVTTSFGPTIPMMSPARTWSVSSFLPLVRLDVPELADELHLPGPRVQHPRAALEDAGVDAGEAQVGVLVRLDLEDERRDRIVDRRLPLRLGRLVLLRLRIDAAGPADGRAGSGGSGRRRRGAAGRRSTSATFRRRGLESPLDRSSAEKLVDRLDREVAVVEVGLHCRVVDDGDRLDELVLPLLRRVEVLLGDVADVDLLPLDSKSKYIAFISRRSMIPSKACPAPMGMNSGQGSAPSRFRI